MDFDARSDQTAAGRIGAWDFVGIVGEGGASARPRPDSFSVLWLVDGTATVTADDDLNERVQDGEAIAVTAAGTPAVSVDAAGAFGVRLDAHFGDPATGTALEIYDPEPFTLRSVITKESGEARVFVGSMFGQTSPVEAPAELVAAELRIAPGAEIAMVLDERFEHGLLALDEGVQLQNTPVPVGEVGVTGAGTKTWGVKNTGGEWARAVVVGGLPTP